MKIVRYQRKRDREGICAMLAEVPFFRAQFPAREAQGVDATNVAHEDGKCADFISLAAGQFLRTRYTGFVLPTHRDMTKAGLLPLF